MYSQVNSSPDAPEQYELVSLDDESCSFVLDTQDRTLLGRSRSSPFADLLAGKLCIASHHAAVCYMDGRFYLISYAANPTFLNNIQLKQNEEYALSDNDVIGLCGKICKGQKDPKGAYFIFRKI